MNLEDAQKKLKQQYLALRGVGGVVVEAVGGDGFAGRVVGVQHMVIKSFM